MLGLIVSMQYPLALKMNAPIRLLAQTWIHIEQPNRGTSFQDVHQLHVVNLHVHFHKLASYQVVLTMPSNMRCSFEPAHARFLFQRCGGQH